MHAAQRANTLHVPLIVVGRFVPGSERAITADTALRLGRWLGTGPELWMDLQTAYDVRRAAQEKGEAIEREV